jgi:putative sigma-54 modulation protein
MDVTEAMREYVAGKIDKLPRYYDGIVSAEAILDKDGDQLAVELVVSARRKRTFVAKYRGPDLYACVDGCVDKIVEQLRRHKDKVRDRQGPSHSGMET